MLRIWVFSILDGAFLYAATRASRPASVVAPKIFFCWTAWNSTSPSCGAMTSHTNWQASLALCTNTSFSTSLHWSQLSNWYCNWSIPFFSRYVCKVWHWEIKNIHQNITLWCHVGFIFWFAFPVIPPRRINGESIRSLTEPAPKFLVLMERIGSQKEQQ